MTPAAKFVESRIEDLCLKVTSGLTPLRGNPDFYVGGTIDWFKTGELNDWFVESSNEKVTQAALDQTSLKIFPAGTVLMRCTAMAEPSLRWEFSGQPPPATKPARP